MKTCKVTGCRNPRGGHQFIWKGLCGEHAAAADRLANVERSRWFARRLAKACLVVALAALSLLGCTAADFESAAADEAPAGEDCGALTTGACVRSGEQYAPSSEACYHVTAACGSVLANCFGDNSSPVANEVLTKPTPTSQGYITTAFDVPPGGCFYFYACSGATFEEAAPTVEVCP